MTKQEDNTAPVVDDTSTDDGAEEVQDSTEDWDEAFDDFYEGKEEETNDDESDDDDSDADDKSDDDDSDADKGDTEKNNSDKETVVENNDDPAEQQRNTVKEALKEVYSEQQAAEAEMQQTISEALSIVRPSGIQDPRVDSDGDPIKGPEDVEKLYNPNTGELFTPSEAREWYNQATERYEQELESAKQEAQYVARVNSELSAGREAVMRNYGDFIKENPEIAQKVLNRYMSTVKIAGEGDNLYIADAPVDILEFYNDVMYPYVELAEKQKEAQEAAAAAEKAKKDANKRAKAQRDESRDFPTSVGDDATKASDELDWDDAFKQYYGNR